jgi:hypothetical protein
MLSKIELLIEHDWNPLIQKYQYLKKTLANFPETNGKYIDGYKTFRYDLGESGSITYFDSLTQNKKGAGRISGPMVENFLPWISKLKEDLTDLNLVGVSLQENTEKLLAHRDGQEDLTVTKHCNLNYILDDHTDITYVQDTQGNTKQYFSVKNTAWLLDTTKKHWTENNTRARYVFQLTFHQDYDEVARWFDQKGKLHYR